MTVRSYDEALEEGRRLNPGMKIGHPGRSHAWPLAQVLFQALRVKLAIDLRGSEDVAPGAAILVSNHKSMLDPLVTVTPTRWRVSAFTKAEAYDSAGGFFFRALGQIPLRRGDDAVTDWALDMAHRCLESGLKVGIYPEGTRGPDHGALYRLAPRVLVPLLEQNPDVPVHAVAVTYDTSRWRTRVRVRISERLPIDARTMSGPEMTAVIRDRLVEIGELSYVDQYAFVVKAREKRRLAEGGSGPA
ncbi:MAG TPA: lysophospholipid acyltransferase family protein [Candidatus Nanopelagicales bacterium]|nr:lysophospholipid acyltransferase family protein [Candidatus Nanopelagicales bacterium]